MVALLTYSKRTDLFFFTRVRTYIQVIIQIESVAYLLQASMVILKHNATKKTAFTNAPNTSARAQPNVFFDHFFGDIYMKERNYYVILFNWKLRVPHGQLSPIATFFLPSQLVFMYPSRFCPNIGVYAFARHYRGIEIYTCIQHLWEKEEAIRGKVSYLQITMLHVKVVIVHSQ